MLCFTYLDVMPDFVDFLLTFGFQARAQDFFFSGFRQRSHLRSAQGGFDVPELGWSGRDMQMCYNLKSVERSDTNRWSVRNCAVHHSFDLKNVRTTWLVVKGDRLMKDRIESSTSERGSPEMSSLQTLDRAFAATLATHLVFCNWSAENWRWYINDLEERFQDTTRRTLSAPVVQLSYGADTSGFTSPTRTQTQKTDKSLLSMFARTETQLTSNIPKTTEKHQHPATQIYTAPATGLMQQSPSELRKNVTPTAMEQSRSEHYDQKDFSFANLRKTHQIEEKANEVALILRLNVKVICQLAQHYRAIIQKKDFPTHLAEECEDDIYDFELRINSIENDLHLQVLRIETLLRLIVDRKNMVGLSAVSPN